MCILNARVKVMRQTILQFTLIRIGYLDNCALVPSKKLTSSTSVSEDPIALTRGFLNFLGAGGGGGDEFQNFKSLYVLVVYIFS